MRQLLGLIGLFFLAFVAGFGGGVAVLVTQALPSCEADPACILRSIVSGPVGDTTLTDDECISETDAVSIQKFLSALGQGNEVNGEQFINEWRRTSESLQGCVALRETLAGACRSIDGGLAGAAICDAEGFWKP